MKKIILLCLSIALCLPLLAAKQEQKQKATEQTEQKQKEPSTLRLTYAMLRLKQQKDYIGAMQYATLLLERNRKNSMALIFVHDNWDKMTLQAQQTIEAHAQDDDLDDAEARCGVYERLGVIEDNLKGVSMPLKGANNSWVWQPEMLYQEGQYNAERERLLRLYLKKAKEALKSYDVETVSLIYDRVLHSTTLLDSEKEGHRQNMVSETNRLIRQLLPDNSMRRNIHDMLLAWELCSLSQHLQPAQEEITQAQLTLQKEIEKRYLELSEEALQLGDSIKAHEYKASAEDWHLIADEQEEQQKQEDKQEDKQKEQ